MLGSIYPFVNIAHTIECEIIYRESIKLPLSSDRVHAFMARALIPGAAISWSRLDVCMEAITTSTIGWNLNIISLNLYTISRKNDLHICAVLSLSILEV